MIGLQFYADKVLQALIKQLPEIKWLNESDQACIPNSSQNLSILYAMFKGVAFIDGKYFYRNKPLTNPVSPAKQVTPSSLRTTLNLVN